MGKGLVLEALCRNGCSLEHLEALVLYGSRIPIARRVWGENNRGA